MRTLTKLITLFSLLPAPATLWAYEDPPDSSDMPAKVFLSKDCSNTKIYSNNCTDNMTGMMSWAWSVRIPDITHIKTAFATMFLGVCEPAGGIF